MTRDPAFEAICEALNPRRSARAWHGGPTPLGALRGVAAETAAWQPAPGRPSIWALTLHIAYWKYAVRRRLSPEGSERFRRHPANFPDVPSETTAAAWRGDLMLLREEHERLARAVDSFPVDRLATKAGTRKRFTHADLIAGIAMHDAYHTGQIQLLKRLWQSRRAR
ncbi:MAG TPA: DinB family protein [Gemmatimonadales bacterium]|nr:DinB family protein [Gemmatimonadales bacterium]